MITEIIVWHEVKKRKPTKKEQAEFDERDIGKVPYILIGDMPENGEKILVATPYGVSIDVCGIDDDYGFYLEETGDWDDVIAWAYLPKYNKSPELKSNDSKKYAMNKRDWVVASFETAAEVLTELVNTPQLTGLHFEFNCEADEVPTMRYEVRRLSLKEKPAEEEDKTEGGKLND